MTGWMRVPFQLDGNLRFLIWRSADDARDSVATDATGRMPVFLSAEALEDYAAKHGMKLDDQDEANLAINLINLDVATHWLLDPDPGAIDCVRFLNSWNLLDDVAAATGASIESDLDANLDLHGKLFWGSNIEPMTPPGHHFTPTWDTDEIARLAKVLNSGLQLFRSVASL